MKKILIFVIPLTISLFGASFDCSKAKTNVEKMICSDKELSVMDENLSKVFKEAIKYTKEKNQLKNEQFAWMKKRNGCKDVKCLIDSYHLQLDYLEKKTQDRHPTAKQTITRLALMSETLYADT